MLPFMNENISCSHLLWQFSPLRLINISVIKNGIQINTSLTSQGFIACTWVHRNLWPSQSVHNAISENWEQIACFWNMTYFEKKWIFGSQSFIISVFSTYFCLFLVAIGRKMFYDVTNGIQTENLGCRK